MLIERTTEAPTITFASLDHRKENGQNKINLRVYLSDKVSLKEEEEENGVGQEGEEGCQ